MNKGTIVAVYGFGGLWLLAWMEPIVGYWALIPAAVIAYAGLTRLSDLCE